MLILTTFYLTKTRASFVGLVVSNVFFFALLGNTIFRRNKLKIIILAVFIVGLSIMFSFKDQTVFKRFSKDINLKGEYKLSGTMFTRYYNILTAIEVAKDYPILGVGLDNYGYVFAPYLRKVYIEKKETRIWTEGQDRVHSSPFDTIVTTGIIGGLISLWFMFSYVKMIWRSLNEQRALIVALCSGVIAYWVQNIFSFGHVPIITLFWFLIGLSVIACREKKHEIKF